MTKEQLLEKLQKEYKNASGSKDFKSALNILTTIAEIMGYIQPECNCVSCINQKINK